MNREQRNDLSAPRGEYYYYFRDLKNGVTAAIANEVDFEGYIGRTLFEELLMGTLVSTASKMPYNPIFSKSITPHVSDGRIEVFFAGNPDLESLASLPLLSLSAKLNYRLKKYNYLIKATWQLQNGYPEGKLVKLPLPTQFKEENERRIPGRVETHARELIRATIVNVPSFAANRLGLNTQNGYQFDPRVGEVGFKLDEANILMSIGFNKTEKRETE